MPAGSSKNQPSGSLFDRTFRLNPAYRIAPRGRLPADITERLGRLPGDGGFWALLYSPTDASLPVRPLDRRETAFLEAFRAPRTPGSLAGMERSPEEEMSLRTHLSDGVLQVERHGEFVSGPDVLRGIAPDLSTSTSERTVQGFSLRAIELAYGSPLSDAGHLSERMYFYNRFPINAHWRGRFPDEGAVRSFLGVEAGGEGAFWRTWRLSGSPRPESAPETTYKIYLSPVTEDLPEVFRWTRLHVKDSGATSLRAAGDPRGLLRPDKLVVYFAKLEDALRFGAAASEALGSARAHGVPFTKQFGKTPLVSIGVDPAPSAHNRSRRGNRSWRATVTHRLAAAILDVRRERPASPLPLVLEAVRGGGIDPAEWKPASEQWFGIA